MRLSLPSFLILSLLINYPLIKSEKESPGNPESQKQLSGDTDAATGPDSSSGSGAGEESGQLGHSADSGDANSQTLEDQLKDTSRGKLEWIRSAGMVASLIRANSESDARIYELQKATALINCLDSNAKFSEMKSSFSMEQSGLRFRYGEMDPSPWIRIAEERIKKISALVRDLAKVADNMTS